MGKVIRQFRAEDLAQLRRIHGAQGFDYSFPDLANPLFVTKLVLVDEGRELASPLETVAADSAHEQPILGAAFLRLTAEAYLLLDPKVGSARQRWNTLLALHKAAERDAWARGLEDVHAWLPPPIVSKFGAHIERLGWVRDTDWTPYCKKVSFNGGC